MKCMKCGSGVQSGQVFCEECLADMAQHPVKPGTPVILPRREKQSAPKRSRWRIRKPEDMIRSLRRAVMLLMALVATLGIALTISIYMLVHQTDLNNPNQLPGQNYGTSESVD